MEEKRSKPLCGEGQGALTNPKIRESSEFAANKWGSTFHTTGKILNENNGRRFFNNRGCNISRFCQTRCNAQSPGAQAR